MSVSQLTPSVEKSALSPPDGRLVFYDVDWREYEEILDAFGERRVRITYDQGVLEIMTLSGPHEWWKSRLAFVLTFLAAELKMHIQSYGSTSVRRRDLKRGLDPDEFFYIAHAKQIRGPRELDFNKDPAPDLAIEIDIRVSSLNRLAVYAALRVPEVWRFDGEALRVYHLQPDGEYIQAERSLSFPSLPLGPFIEHLKAKQYLDDAELIDPFCKWVRANALPRRPKGPGTGRRRRE
jgi:Uma2 family endonuclease